MEHIFVSKKIVLILILLALISLYLTFIFNQCVIDNLSGVFPKWQRHPLVANDNRPNHHSSSLQLVPFQKILRSEIPSKYKLYLEQGLYPSRQLPRALIIGVKKGGTRALLEFIRVHPDVRAAGSEIHFFDRNYYKGYEWYRQHMPPTLEGQLTIEKTPSYFITKNAPKRVQHMNPSIRLIVVVRDPVTRAISDYTQAISKKPDIKPFEQLSFVNSSTGSLVDTSWGPVKLGIYVRYLERWLKYFNMTQILFVNGEGLVTDPATELFHVQDFLGLKQVVSEKHFYFNSTKGFPCLFKSEGHSSPHCLGKTKGRSHPYVDPVVIQRLRDFYRPFNERFYQVTGINFGWE